ncbi:MAG: GSCFA domain-containing protein [Candidatus Methylumidiphilus sp.]
MNNPYQSLSHHAFWRTAVAEKNPLLIDNLWNPRHPITADAAIVTAGSCFAQHIGKALVKSGYNWLNAEPAPRLLPDHMHQKYGYGVFSFRTGNIYTAALLKQWVSWAFGETAVPTEIWEGNSRFYDPFRPNIEPNGFASPDELLALRQSTFAAIRRAAEEAKLWIFTLGLTEAWVNTRQGHVYPMCPGTAAGQFVAASHKFHNFRHAEICRDLADTFAMLRQANADAKFLLTVSPVPLAATASGNHVLSANQYSKSTLRAVAEDMKNDFDNVDYFPSYEIITGFPYRGIFFEPNLRKVSASGVDFVMRLFLQSVQDKFCSQPTGEAAAAREPPTVAEAECEEALLEAFAGGK